MSHNDFIVNILGIKDKNIKIMKSYWKLFHTKAEELHLEEVVFLRGVK